MKVNDNIILGYVGWEEDINTVIGHMNAELADIIGSIMVDELLEYFTWLLDNNDSRKISEFLFMVIGRDRNGQMIFSEIGKPTDFKPETTIVAKPVYPHIGGMIDHEVISDIVDKKISTGRGSIIPLYMDIIRSVAKIDVSVNRNCYYVIV